MRETAKENIDVLRHIELAIVQAQRQDRSLLDLDVQGAVEALVRHYHAEDEERTTPVMRIGDRAQRVFTSVQQMCEWRLGRASAPIAQSAPPISLEALVDRLRELRKSIIFWSKRGGRQEYLNYIAPFVQ